MLKKKYRLNARRLLQKPKVYHSSFFTLHVLKSDLPYSRCGFVVSKKIDKRAVVRNKAKRKVRRCVEQMQNKMYGGYDMLFFLKKNVIQASSLTLCGQVEQILKKEKLLI